MRNSLALAAGLALLSAAPVAAQPALDPPGQTTAALARTDHAVTGNRIAPGRGPLRGQVVDVSLGGTPAWVLPDPTDRGRSWLVVFADGSVEHVIAEAEGAAWVSRTDSPPLPPGEPPLAASVGAGRLVVGSALAAGGWFEAPIPDARVTELDGGALVAPTRPTDRYAHGVLGDDLEASAIDVRDAQGLVVRIEVAEHEVVEGTSAMIIGLAADTPARQLLVTISDADHGARLRVYDPDGTVVAESEPIGQGYRWLHQLGAAAIGPEGEIEVVAVRTPHLGGVVEAYRRVGDRLELVASLAGYSSHRLGSANLDMALLAEVSGDGRLEVVVPTQDMRSLGLLTRTGDGFEEVGRLDLGGELATNVTATAGRDGELVLAAGTADGRLRIFR